MLDLAGLGTAMTQREALRERIKQHVAQHLGDPSLTVDCIAHALSCSRRQLYNAFAEEADGVTGYILRGAGSKAAARPSTAAAAISFRSPTWR